MPTNDDPTKQNNPLTFKATWTLEEAQRVIRAEEKAFKHVDGAITSAELLLFSVDQAETTNVGVFEDRERAAEFPVMLVDGLPKDADDREMFFQGLGRRGLELICYSDLLVAGKIAEVAVCRAITAPKDPAIVDPVPHDPDPVAPSGLISEDAFSLIIEFEGLDQPGSWPGASSGITLGVGYDLGFVSAAQFAADWARHLTEAQIARLKTAIGLTGGRAAGVASRFGDIKITRTAGMEVFNRCTLPRFTKITRGAFPGMEKLPVNAQGALISLTFNRGSKMDGPSRAEMAEIRRLIQTAKLPEDTRTLLPRIASQIRQMKRLWDVRRLRGLHRRRDAEADLVLKAATDPGKLIQILGTVVDTVIGTVIKPAVPAGTSTAEKLVALARAHCNIGEKYRLGAFVPKDKQEHHGPWDCAEFVSWCIYQIAGCLYGCENNAGPAASADAYTGYWERDAKARGRMISIDEAARTPGAILLRYPPQSGTGHIALSDGQGHTLEAKGTQFGVVTDKVSGRRWDTGMLIEEITYPPAGTAAPVQVASRVYFVGAKNMEPAVTIAIQDKLRAAGFDPGPSDGDFGDQTAEAVLAFQAANQLMVDGEVGPETAGKLGVTL